MCLSLRSHFSPKMLFVCLLLHVSFHFSLDSVWFFFVHSSVTGCVVWVKNRWKKMEKSEKIHNKNNNRIRTHSDRSELNTNCECVSLFVIYFYFYFIFSFEIWGMECATQMYTEKWIKRDGWTGWHTDRKWKDIESKTILLKATLKYMLYRWKWMHLYVYNECEFM